MENCRDASRLALSASAVLALVSDLRNEYKISLDVDLPYVSCF